MSILDYFRNKIFTVRRIRFIHPDYRQTEGFNYFMKSNSTDISEEYQGVKLEMQKIMTNSKQQQQRLLVEIEQGGQVISR